MPDRSIRNIQVNHRHPQPAHHEQPAPRARRKRGRRLWIVALVLAVVAAALGTLVSFLFAGANVRVTPRAATVTPPSSIQAVLNAPVGTLSYQEASVSLSATTTVPAKGTEQVQTPASGVITIQNTYGSASQRLIPNTRFQAPDGKIYKIRDAVVVPGMSGGQSGTITAVAYADSPGPDYNRTGTTVYTIPGFKGDPRYAKISAVSGPMTGGFSGAKPAVAPNDLAAAKNAMEAQLDSSVRAQFANNLPEGYRLIAGTMSVTFGELNQTDAGGGQAAISEAATAHGYVVRDADLAAAIAKLTVQGYQGEAVGFVDPSSLGVSASTTGQASNLTIKLAGSQTTLVWQFDPGALKAALVGQPKSQFEAIIKQFQPAIAKADASIRPFWTSTFPSDPDKISVTKEAVK